MNMQDVNKDIKVFELYGEVFAKHSKSMREVLKKMQDGEVSKKQAADVCYISTTLLSEALNGNSLIHAVLISLAAKFSAEFDEK
jgi:hypothetical protein